MEHIDASISVQSSSLSGCYSDDGDATGTSTEFDGVIGEEEEETTTTTAAALGVITTTTVTTKKKQAVQPKKRFSRRVGLNNTTNANTPNVNNGVSGEIGLDVEMRHVEEMQELVSCEFPTRPLPVIGTDIRYY